MRTFIAVDLPEEIKSRISAFVRERKAAAPRGLGWSNPADLHVTLKFLGEIEESRADEVGRAVRDVAADTPVFSLSVAGTGTFPPGSRRPRVLWIGLEESRALDDLQSRLETALEARGFPREDRPFRPHLTAARVKGPGIPPDFIERWTRPEEAAFGRLDVREVVVYRSILKPGGAEHRPLFSGALHP